MDSLTGLLASMVPCRGMELGSSLCSVHMPTQAWRSRGQRDRSDLREAQWPLTLGPTLPAAPLDTLCALALFFQMVSPEEVFSLTGTHRHQLKSCAHRPAEGSRTWAIYLKLSEPLSQLKKWQDHRTGLS